MNQSNDIAYGRLCFTPQSIKKLKDLCLTLGIKEVSDEFHCTVLYSRENVDELVMNDFDWSDDFPFFMKVTGMKVFGKRNNCLVLTLKSDKARSIHQYFIDNGASYDYPDYQPHVTLTYDWSGDGIPKFNPRMIAEELEVSHILIERSTDDYDPRSAQVSISERYLQKIKRAKKMLESKRKEDKF